MIRIQKPLIVQTSPKIYSQNPGNNYNLSTNNKDTISFTGLRVSQAKTTQEIRTLGNLFFDALKHNLEPHSKTPKIIEKITRHIATYPLILVAKQPSSITEMINYENKLAGGYSMNLDLVNHTAHLGFITLAPDLVKTKKGLESLKLMGKRICQNLEVDNIKELTFTTNSKNKFINNLLKKIGAAKVKKFFSETEYKISFDQLKEITEKYTR